MSKEKTRNGNQWTEARFRSFVTSALRAATRRWPPKWTTLSEALEGVRRNKNTGRRAKHFRCAGCSGLFVQTAVQVDHIAPIGRDLDWNQFIERLFCEKENLQVLCKPCHKEKSKRENQASS